LNVDHRYRIKLTDQIMVDLPCNPMKPCLGFSELLHVLWLTRKPKLVLQLFDFSPVCPLQLDTFLAGYPPAVSYYFFDQLAVCRERNVFLLDCRIYPYLFNFPYYILFPKEIYAL